MSISIDETTTFSFVCRRDNAGPITLRLDTAGGGPFTDGAAFIANNVGWIWGSSNFWAITFDQAGVFGAADSFVIGAIAPTNAAGQDIIISAQDAESTDAVARAGGNVTITSGSGSGIPDGDSGDVSLVGAVPATDGAGGAINLTSGNGVGAGNIAGDINLTLGTGPGANGAIVALEAGSTPFLNLQNDNVRFGDPVITNYSFRNFINSQTHTWDMLDAGAVSRQMLSINPGPSMLVSIPYTGATFSCPGVGSQSEMFGNGTTAAGSQAVCVGFSANANGQGSIGIGANCSAGSLGNIAIGEAANASGARCICIGDSSASGATTESIALGFNAQPTASNQFVIGSPTEPITTTLIDTDGPSWGISMTDAGGATRIMTRMDPDTYQFDWGAGNNAQRSILNHETELVSLPAGATVDSTITIPANAILLAVTLRVFTLITGPASFDLGTPSTPARFYTSVPLTVGTTRDLSSTLETSPLYQGGAGAEPIRFVASGGGGAFTGGSVRLTLHYLQFTAATS